MAAWEGEGCSAVPAGLQECSAVAAGAGLALVVCRFSVRGVCVTRRVSNDLTTTPCGEVRPGSVLPPHLAAALFTRSDSRVAQPPVAQKLSSLTSCRTADCVAPVLLVCSSAMFHNFTFALRRALRIVQVCTLPSPLAVLAC